MLGLMLRRRYTRTGHFRFLDLPPEIRNEIYGHMLTFPGATYPSDSTPTSVASLYKYKPQAERDSIPIPHSALDILRVNRQVHDEAHKIFYSQNDLVFSRPVHLQDFMLSLGDGRLDTIRKVTLFYDNNNDRFHESRAITEATLLTLRLLRGLQELHLLVGEKTTRDGFLTWFSRGAFGNEYPGSFPGVRLLFAFRNLTSITMRYLPAEDFASRPGSESQRAEQQVAIFKHFSRGLQMAQQGSVVRELYIDRDWHKKGMWPALEGSDCGSEKGCDCGQNEGEGSEGKDGRLK